jgi:hypothetical protein
MNFKSLTENQGVRFTSQCQDCRYCRAMTSSIVDLNIYGVTTSNQTCDFNFSRWVNISFVVHAVNSHSVSGGTPVSTWSRSNSLWFEARKHIGKELQQMWNKSHWPWEQLFWDRSSMCICAITILPCTRGYSGLALRQKDRYMVTWLYISRTLHWKCKWLLHAIVHFLLLHSFWFMCFSYDVRGCKQTQSAREECTCT